MRRSITALVLVALLAACAPAPTPAATSGPVPTLYPTGIPKPSATKTSILLPTYTRAPTTPTLPPTETPRPTRTAKPTTGPTWTLSIAESTRAAAKFSPTPTGAIVAIADTPAPIQAADTATVAPIIQDTPTAEPVVQPTQAPPPSGGGYVCDGGAACIKGNISSNGHLYHFPGCPSYNATKIDEGAGERYFTSAAEAEAAGWVKAGNCP